MDRLNYHHPLYFWVSAKERSINSASMKFGIGQPTISTQVKNLEESLEQNMFDRKNRALVLTEAGKVGFDYANQIFAIGNELMEVIKDGEGDNLFRELQAHRVDMVILNFPPSIGNTKQFFSWPLEKKSLAIYGVKKFHLYVFK